MKPLRILVLLALTASAFAVETIPAGKKVTLRTSYEGQPSKVEYFKDGVKVFEGADLVIPVVAATDAGTYRAFVSNDAGSAEATVQIAVTSEEPGVRSVTIANSNAAETIPIAAAFTLTATAMSLTAPTFQWIRDDAYLPGATASTYAVAVVSASDAGLYSVVASDSAGFVRSNVIAVVVSSPPVGTPPVITAGPVSITVPKKGTARFSVTATGTGLRYQWYKGTTLINGATLATLTIASVKPPDAGSYLVTVSNDAGYAKVGAMLTVR